MSTASAPFGLQPAAHISGGTIRQDYMNNGIASGYSSNIFSNTPVKRTTDGTLVVCSTGVETAIGVFAGCEFSSAGKFFVSPYWPASQTYDNDGTMQAYFTTDPNILYDAQCDGSVAASKIGEAINLANTTQGSTYTGQSTQALSATTTGATAGLAVVRSIPTGPYPGGGFNAPADAYTVVRVQLTYQVPIA